MTQFFFIAIPYLALSIAVIGGLYRYFSDKFSYTSDSSQLLENRMLFWGSVPWHYGIIPILLAHLFGGLFPGAAARVLHMPARLATIELIGLALGLYTLFGIVVLISRRLRRASPVHYTTTRMDGLLLAVLLLQAVTGVWTAIVNRWGSIWYLNTATPWFWSIVSFRPDPARVAVLPFLIKMHMVNGFIVILLFPFTRLVHVFTVPVTYLWRSYQVVIWLRKSRRAPASPEAAK